MSNTSSHRIQINSIKCNSTSETGHDEVYIVYQADAGIPIRYPLVPGYNAMEKGDTWDLTLELSFDHEVLVTLWDQDISYLSRYSDFLINCDFTVAAFNGQSTLSYNMINNNGANYTIAATLIS